MFEIKKILDYLVLTDNDTQLTIDFASNALEYRRKHGGGHGQLVAKACGLKKYSLPLTILDATAGVGNDGYILASLGCEVYLCEENAQIFSLLQDAHQRALNNSNPAIALIAARMYLHHGNSSELIPQICSQQAIDIIYFDPMFPESKKSALPKNSMQILRKIATYNTLEDEIKLLTIASKYAHKRIVVKRHKNSPFFANCKPHASIHGKTNRFDLYTAKTPDIDSLEITL